LLDACVFITGGGIVQQEHDFITVIAISSANSCFHHERRHCSARTRFHHGNCDFISQFVFSSREKHCSARTLFHHGNCDFISQFVFSSREKHCSARTRFHHGNCDFISQFVK